MQITVTVKPNAKTRTITPGATPNTFKVTTPKAPDENKANKDVIDIVAEHFHVAKSQVELVRGHTSKTKILKIMA